MKLKNGDNSIAGENNLTRVFFKYNASHNVYFTTLFIILLFLYIHFLSESHIYVIQIVIPVRVHKDKLLE